MTREELEAWRAFAAQVIDEVGKEQIHMTKWVDPVNGHTHYEDWKTIAKQNLLLISSLKSAWAREEVMEEALNQVFDEPYLAENKSDKRNLIERIYANVSTTLEKVCSMRDETKEEK